MAEVADSLTVDWLSRNCPSVKASEAMIAAYIVFAVAIAVALTYLGLVHSWLRNETTDSNPSKPTPAPAPSAARPQQQQSGNLRPAHV
jgi:hypothetical protein